MSTFHLVRSLIATAAMAALCLTSAESASAQARSLQLVNANVNAPNYVRIPDAPSLRPAHFTVECWFRADGNGMGSGESGSLLVGRPAQNTSGSWLNSWALWYVPNAHKVSFEIESTVFSAGQGSGSVANVPLGVPTHVAVVYDGVFLKMYINGELDTQVGTTVAKVDYSRPDDLVIGAANYGYGYLRRFQGLIDEVRLWDHGRTTAEIAASWGRQACGPQPGLLGLWGFENGSLADTSGNAHNGVAMNSVAFTSPMTNLSLGPVIVDQPGVVVADIGLGVGFDISANDLAAFLTYQWQIADASAAGGWRDIHDGPTGNGSTYAGTQTTFLAVLGSAWADAGQYRCGVSDGCTTTYTNPGTIDLRCPADFNHDNFVDVYDFTDFITAFETGC